MPQHNQYTKPGRNLTEYGLYIRKNPKTGKYGLGILNDLRHGPLISFDTHDQATEFAEEMIGQFWEYNYESFVQALESMVYYANLRSGKAEPKQKRI